MQAEGDTRSARAATAVFLRPSSRPHLTAGKRRGKGCRLRHCPGPRARGCWSPSRHHPAAARRRCWSLQRCQGLVRSDPAKPATRGVSWGFAGSSDHVQALQEKARRDLNPLPALGRGTRAAFTMQMNPLSRWHWCWRAPVTSSAGRGIISAGLL